MNLRKQVAGLALAAVILGPGAGGAMEIEREIDTRPAASGAASEATVPSPRTAETAVVLSGADSVELPVAAARPEPKPAEPRRLGSCSSNCSWLCYTDRDCQIDGEEIGWCTHLCY